MVTSPQSIRIRILIPLLILVLTSALLTSFGLHIIWKNTRDAEYATLAKHLTDPLLFVLDSAESIEAVQRWVSIQSAAEGVDLIAIVGHDDDQVLACSKLRWVGQPMQALSAANPSLQALKLSRHRVDRTIILNQPDNVVYGATFESPLLGGKQNLERGGTIVLALDRGTIRLASRSVLLAVIGTWIPATLVFALALWLLVDRLILQPIRTLVGALNMRPPSGIAPRIPSQGRRDEFGYLIDAYNRFIDDAEASQRSLQDSEERYRQIFQHNTAIKLVVDPEDGRIVDANKSACVFYGYTHDELCARTIMDINTLPPEAVKAQMAQVKIGDERQLNFRHRLRSGEVRDVIVYSGPLSTREGIRLCSIIHDVTAQRQAQLALAESESRYRGLVESQTALIVRVDADGRFTFCNDAYCRMFGKERSELLGSTFHPLVHEDDLPATLQAMEALTHPPHRIVVEQRARTPMGWRWFSWEDDALLGPDGRIQEIQAVGHDITEQKKNLADLQSAHDTLEQTVQDRTAALEESQHQFKTLFDIMTQGVLFFDQSGRITAFNPAARHILGLSSNELTGAALHHPDWRTIQTNGQEFPPEQLPAAVALRTGRPVFCCEVGLIAPGAPTPLWLAIDAIPFRSFQEGEGRGVLATFTDITQRRLAEEHLLEVTVRFTSAFAHAPIGMALVAPDGRWLKVNQSVCSLLGYTENELLSRNFQSVTHPDDLAEDMAHVQRMLSGAALTYQMEKRYFHRDGHIVWCLLSVSLVRDLNQQPQYFISQVVDISARKEAEFHSRVMFEVLNILNNATCIADAARLLVDLLHQELGLEAIGIRVSAGSDFPYVAHRGFPQEFAEAEMHLCSAQSAMPEPGAHPDGTRLECTCGLVLEGRMDPSNPLCTPTGSVWTNDASIAQPVGTPPRYRPRNRCIEAGYRTIALIPIRSAVHVVGLLQLNDHQPNRLSQGQVKFLESVANSIGVAIFRLQAEAQRQESAAQLQLALDAAKAGVWSWDVKTNENQWSHSLFALYGLDPQTTTPSFETWRDAIHPDDRERAVQTVTNAARAGAELNAEWRVLDKDGASRWIVSRGYPIRNGEGTVTHYRGVAMDVTEHNRNAERLQQLQTAVEQASDGIAVASLDGVLLYTNAAFARMHNAEPYQLIGEPLSAIHTAEQMSSDVRPHLDILLKQGHHSGVVGHRRSDGSVFPAWMSTSILHDSQGQRIGLLAIARDITNELRAETERKTLQAQLTQAQKLESVGRLAAGVAHDFNNNMFCVLGYTEIIKAEIPADSPLLPHLLQIEQATSQATDITRQLLAFSRQQMLHVEPIDLNALVITQEKMLRRLIGENIEIVLGLHPSPVTTLADQAQVQQVILNLAINARDAMPDGGTLLVTTGISTATPPQSAPGNAHAGVYAWMMLADTGSGMSPKTLERIFDPFFTTKEAGKGTGLGLAVVHGIVQQHGGWIDVQSREGVGTSFWVYLPHPRDVEASTDKTGPQPPLPRGTRQYVLLVEDERLVREVAMLHLQSLNYQVIAASNLATARKAWAEAPSPIRLMLSDVQLPDGTGVALAEELLRKDPELKVVMTSGYADEQSRFQDIQKWGWPFLSKPYTKAQLASVLNTLLIPPCEQGM